MKLLGHVNLKKLGMKVLQLICCVSGCPKNEVSCSVFFPRFDTPCFLWPQTLVNAVAC